MKLILCPKCQDVRKLLFENTYCQCGKSYGRYIDNLNAEIGGYAIPIGFSNSSFVSAIRNQPDNPPGMQFTAFVIEKNCKTIKVKE